MTRLFILSTKLSLFALTLAAVILLPQASVTASSGQTAGDLARGQAVFEGKGNCLSCHRVADQGSYMGPNLSSIGKSVTAAQLQKSILDPNPEVRPQNRLYKAVTSDGATITGRLLNQDIYIIQMLTSESRLVTLKKSALRSYDFTETPPMPSYRDKLTPDEQTDLIAYLLSLQGVVKQ
jgi:putative heme-binding domain-containing protein